MGRNYVEETKAAAGRSIEHSKLAYNAAKQGTEKAEACLSLIGWQENVERVRYAPERDSCGAYIVTDKETRARALDRHGNVIPAMSYGSAWETCKTLNGWIA